MATNPVTGLRLPADVDQWLRLQAAQQRRSISSLVAEMVRREIERVGPGPLRVRF